MVLLEGVNHAQLSNAVLREGDLDPEQADAAATQGAARVIGSFIAATISAERCGVIFRTLGKRSFVMCSS